jgi:flavin reductase (DIM6/NTAB) family NADH-FMN oxidoreductase RutF
VPSTESDFVTLDPQHPVWERCFLVAPLVLIGSVEEDGSHDLAPKHLATPLSWTNHFGFVCTPTHGTYRNVARTKQFTVSFPRPDQVVLTSLAAAPRCDAVKPSLAGIPVSRAERVDGVVVDGVYLQLECELDRIVDGFGDNSLVAGTIVAARAASEYLRDPDKDDPDVLANAPALAYLHPGRFARIGETFSFPFHTGFSR